MIPSKEYLDSIASKLDRLNPGIDLTVKIRKEESQGSKEILGILGDSGMNYMNNHKQAGVNPDPLFPDRNTY